MANKHKKKKLPLDPHDVLTGEISLSPLELIRMIHRVNPTSDGVRSAEAVERYQLKAKLQSLLIRLHRDGLRVEQTDPEQPQLIGLRLQHFAEDACHALIPELDEDARSWVQRQIDEGNCDTVLDSSADIRSSHLSSVQGQSTPDAEITDKTSSAELIENGRKALEEYDYERCELYFRRALERSPGNGEAVASLLDLWVNHLAVYETARGFAESLPKQAKKDKNVRILLGLACARSNLGDDALAWIENLLEPEVAEIYFLCAAHFIKQSDNTRASEMLLLLKSCQSSAFAVRIVELEKDVRALQAKSLEPLEDEMAQAWHAGDVEKASCLAIRLLSLLPENKAAQKIINENNRREQSRKIDRLLQLADEAQRRNDAITEADFLSQAITAGEDSDALRQRCEKLRQEVRRKREELEIEKVLALLVAGDQAEALLAYTELQPVQRQHIQSSLKYPHLLWIDQALAADISVKTEKIVKAVIALGQSKDALEKGDDPQQVINQIQHHSKVLQSISLTPLIMEQAEMQLKMQELAKIAELMMKAQNALAADNLNLTRDLLEQIKVTRLEHDDKTRYDEINGTLSKLEGIHLLGQKYKDCVKREDHLAAREIAGRFAALHQGVEAANWREKIEHHAAGIKKEWRLISADIEELPLCYGLLDLEDYHNLQHNCPLLDGRHLLFASAYDRWIFLRTFDVDDQKFKKAYMLRSPKPLSFIGVTQRGNSLWIASAECYLIEVSLNPFDIISARDYSDFIGDGWGCEDAWIFPGRRYLWINKRENGGSKEEIIEIIPVDQQRSSRQIKCANTSFPAIINAGGEFRIAIGERSGRFVRMYSESGKVIETYMLETSGVLSEATLHPDGSAIVFMSYDDAGSWSFEEEPENMGDYLLKLEVKPDVEKKNKPIKIPDSGGELHHSMCTSLDAGIIYVDFENPSSVSGNYNLTAWKPSEEGLTMLYRIPISRNFFFAGDELSRRVAAVQFSDREIKVAMLDEHPPAFELAPDKIEAETDIPTIPSHWICYSPTGPLKDSALALKAQMKKAAPKEYQRKISEMKQTASPDEIAALAQAMALMYHFEEKNNLELWMKEAYPHHYTVQIELAEEAASNADWQRVIAIVTGIVFEGLDDGTIRHLCHLLGIAYFVAGNVESALTTWQKGLECADGACDLLPLVKFAELSLLSPQQRKELEDENILAKRLSLFEEIDRQVMNKNWMAVITLFETEYPMDNTDLQILSRLAHAYLNMNDEPDDMRWIGKFIVMAYYCARFHDSYRKEFILPPSIEKWSTARLNDIYVSAEQWLAAR